MRTRDALEPLLKAFDMAAAEQGGGVVLTGSRLATAVLAPDDLALPDEGVSMIRKRVAEPTPSTARVRFIDEGADYQTGAVTIRSGAGAGADGGAVDLILPAVCGAALASGMARRALSSAEADRLVIAAGPLDVLTLEAGDVIAWANEEGRWRIESLNLDETPTLTLARVMDGEPTDAAEIWRPGDAPTVFAEPFFAVLDLPPLPGAEADERPVLAVAANPWRAMRVFAGPGGESLTSRGETRAPARLGLLTQALTAGVTGRWDEANSIVVAVEGAAPASLGQSAVLAGANAVAIQAGDGWEILQFSSAQLVVENVWRLTGLLRAQQGTDAEMATGSAAGALVVFLDEGLGRGSALLSEIGLPLIWRAGPVGGAAGGQGVSERSVTLRGVFHRPWSPAHLRIDQGASGYDIRWISRTRLNGDLWDRDLAADPMRFRIRVLDGGDVVRIWEVEGTAGVYETGHVTADFPAGPGPGVRIGVSQAGEIFGWGSEAVTGLPV